MRIEKKSLRQLTPLAKGGFGEVFRVGGYHLPGDPADLAYKQFTTEVALQARSAQAAVAFRAGLSQAEQADLDSHAVWPRALVEEPRGTVIGLLMPLIPADFFCRKADPNTGAVQDAPREMGWLGASAKHRAIAQVDLRDVDRLERLILLGKLVLAIGWLHKRGWVFGDLSFRNAVFALDPPRVMLLDCDGAAALSDHHRKQATTPFWDPPEGAQRQQDDRTDVYKLGLAIVRCMVPGKGAASDRAATRVAGEIDPQGVAIVARAVGADRGQRPSARELYDYFYQVVSARVTPPVVTAAQLRNPDRVRGQDARIDWQITNAVTVTVFAGAQRFAVDIRQRPDGFGFRPDESGPVAIEVANRFGTLRLELGDISLYELPPFKVDYGFLPTPRVPRLPPLPMAALDRVIAGAPATGLPDMPAVPSLDTFGLVGSLMRSAAVTAPLPPLGAAVADASAALTAALQAQAGTVGASVQAAYLAAQGQGGNVTP